MIVSRTSASLFVRDLSKANRAALTLHRDKFEGRLRWAAGGKELSIIYSLSNLKALARIEFLPNLDDLKGCSDKPVPPKGSGGDYRPKTEPFPHQMEADAHCKRNSKIALFMEQGTGKTKVLLDWIGRLWCSQEITGAVVVSKKGVHRQWAESEVETHLGVDATCFVWEGKAFKPEVQKQFGKSSTLQIFCINYDALVSKEGFRAADEFVKAHGPAHLAAIADESQEVKNFVAKRSKHLTALTKEIRHKALATGTPLAKNLMDLFAQFFFLDPNILGSKYMTTFRREFCVMGGYEGKEIIGHQNMDVFQKRIAPHVFRVSKDQLGILPKEFSTWSYRLTPAQKRLIRQIRDELMAILPDRPEPMFLQNIVTHIVKIQQVAAGFITDENGTDVVVVADDSNPKLEEALSWLASREGRKCILWTRFIGEQNMLSRALENQQYEFVTYFGSTGDKARSDAVKSFLSPTGAQVLLASPQAAGTGLNLQGGSNDVLYYSNSFRAIDRWQSEDRNHRIGTHGVVTYTDLVARGCFDHMILGNLRNKKNFADSTLQLSDLTEALRGMQ